MKHWLELVLVFVLKTTIHRHINNTEQIHIHVRLLLDFFDKCQVLRRQLMVWWVSMTSRRMSHSEIFSIWTSYLLSRHRWSSVLHFHMWFWRLCTAFPRQSGTCSTAEPDLESAERWREMEKSGGKEEELAWVGLQQAVIRRLKCGPLNTSALK